jgi:hypothetical protein
VRPQISRKGKVRIQHGRPQLRLQERQIGRLGTHNGDEGLPETVSPLRESCSIYTASATVPFHPLPGQAMPGHANNQGRGSKLTMVEMPHAGVGRLPRDGSAILHLTRRQWHCGGRMSGHQGIWLRQRPD